MAVVRHAADQGRLSRPGPHAGIEHWLGKALLMGWDLDWHAVRRRVNTAADALSTEAVHRASRLADRGHTVEDVRVHFFEAAHLAFPESLLLA